MSPKRAEGIPPGMRPGGPVVDRKECVRCGVCVDTAPSVFRLDPSGKSEVFDPHGAPEEDIRRAIDRCPVGCIAWKEGE